MTLNYDPKTLIPTIGMWVTFCCALDAEELKTSDDVQRFLAERDYVGAANRAYKTRWDLVMVEEGTS